MAGDQHTSEAENHWQMFRSCQGTDSCFFPLWLCSPYKQSRRAYLKRQQERGEKKRGTAWILADERVCPAPPGVMILIVGILFPWGSGCFPCWQKCFIHLEMDSGLVKYLCQALIAAEPTEEEWSLGCQSKPCHRVKEAEFKQLCYTKIQCLCITYTHLVFHSLSNTASVRPPNDQIPLIRL